jgi:putative membrane protein
MVKLLMALAFAAVVLPAAAIAEVPAKTLDPSTSGAPLEGANSFTEAQARQRISDAGYKDIGTLKKDDQGIWRTEAKKNGAAVSVSVDFKGNIVPTEGK